jgi:hypothetical protein
MAPKRKTWPYEWSEPQVIPDAPWRVHWWDFRDRKYHNYIGRGAKNHGRAISISDKDPPRHSSDFETYAAARAFIDFLKQEFGVDNVIARPVDMRALLPPKPTQPRIPGAVEWPIQWDPWRIKPSDRSGGEG